MEFKIFERIGSSKDWNLHTAHGQALLTQKFAVGFIALGYVLTLWINIKKARKREEETKDAVAEKPVADKKKDSKIVQGVGYSTATTITLFCWCGSLAAAIAILLFTIIAMFERYRDELHV